MNSQTTATSPPALSLQAPRQPMLWAALAHGAGIVVGVYAWRPAVWWLVAAMLFILFAAYFVRRRAGFGWALAVAVFFLSGAVSLQMRSACNGLDTSIQDFADRTPVENLAGGKMTAGQRVFVENV